VTGGTEGATPAIELFKGTLAYLILREVPDLPAYTVLKVVQDVVAGHGSQSVTAQVTLGIIDEAMGAAHAASDELETRSG